MAKVHPIYTSRRASNFSLKKKNLKEIQYTALEICDDEDIDCMISAFQQESSRNVIELYVDIAVGGRVRNDVDEDNKDSGYESYNDEDDEAEFSLGSSSTDVEGEFQSNLNIQVTENVGGMVNEEPFVHISLIQERICAQFGYKISYKKAWKAKQKAIIKVFGDWDESYAMLPHWFKVFERLFWSFKQCHEAFKFCKPILQVDETFLYGKYRHTLLIATTQDGNNCVLLIAFAIVEGETLLGICLISDRHQSIKGAVSNPHIGWQPPNAYLITTRQISEPSPSPSPQTRSSAPASEPSPSPSPPPRIVAPSGSSPPATHDPRFRTYTPSRVIFEQKLTRFCNESEDIQRWIDCISKEKWALSYDDEGRCYGHMTTNLSEAVNKVLKGSRNLPITALVKATFGRLVEYFVKRGEEAMYEFHNGIIFCRKVMLQIQKNQEEASHTKFVDMTFKEKVLRRFQCYRFPCSHVIAACIAVSIDFWQYVDPVYSLQYVVNAYSPQWFPFGNECNIVTNSEWKLVPDVDRARGKGRPKSTRIRNEMDWVESQTRQRCSNCNEVGHNQRHCPQQNNVH
ncbi:uncharacterized protein LOC113866717 [Abrus precatorius]|uniref:Uncharacterized protein LOC113866717 n=1 Tax=Abrus precatorius TaxID=3816 RepID=A0A8B8LPI6_ABRPR|nr:uncharacterized protein LOC113866717 [Abrus precatorius]